MAQDTKATPVLLPVLLELLAAARPAFAQERCFRRLIVLAVGLLGAFSRHTLTQVLATLGWGEQDWSAAYRLFSAPRFDGERLRRDFVGQTLRHVGVEQPYLVALDGVQLPRHSRTMPGTSWLHQPLSPPFRRGIHRAQRFSHLAWLIPPTAAGYSRALPLRWDPAFPAKAVLATGMTAAKEWEAGLAGLRWLPTTLDAAGRPAQAVLAVADGLYSNQYVWRALPAGVRLLARCAHHRALYALPPPLAGAGKRGRPRKYGERAPTPRAWLSERSGWTSRVLAVRGRQVPCTYRVAGPYLVKGAPDQPLFLLVVRGLDRVRRGHRRQRKPAFWLVSAVRPADDGPWELPWPAEHLLGWAWQRWEIEVTHRDLKSGFGIGESQCWNPVATVVSVQWRVWVWSLVVLTGYRVWGMERGPLRPLGRRWGGSGRWSFGQLWQGLRQELWELREFQTVRTGIPGKPPKKADRLAFWANATLAARRA